MSKTWKKRVQDRSNLRRRRFWFFVWAAFIKTDVRRWIFPLNKLKPRLLRDNRAPPVPDRTSARFFSSRRSLEGWKRKKKKKKREEGKGRKGAREGLLHRGSVFPSIILFSILLSFESTRATRSPPLPPSISLFHIYAPDGIPRGKFSSVVQNGLHYHNLSDGTPTPPRGLGGFNVIINQNPEDDDAAGSTSPPLPRPISSHPLIIRDFDYEYLILRVYFMCVN